MGKCTCGVSWCGGEQVCVCIMGCGYGCACGYGCGCGYRRWCRWCDARVVHFIHHILLSMKQASAHGETAFCATGKEHVAVCGECTICVT